MAIYQIARGNENATTRASAAGKHWQTMIDFDTTNTWFDGELGESA